MRILHHMRELQDAIGDWERYQCISREQFFSDRDTRNMVFHAMMVGIQSAIDIATDLIAEERLRRPASYRETFEILRENGILPEPLTRDLSALAGFRNVLVHIYWDLDLEQVYAILHQDLIALKGFFAAIQEHLQERRLSDQ
ncbi:type VII toxin-antitoxin system HepT family RNase toxin [Methanofollis fontis]|uniref:DUF86 domain-containing protein n=1 Tax=Methanofollis fontis TaxID=2052832 RepID=A0A483CX69_9EURY|nr:DUF86 domain-containing protein [Methanofollis fontis]TAJ43712.1 DUF86 domain-containing protein [Methanofollis fontis]